MKDEIYIYIIIACIIIILGINVAKFISKTEGFEITTDGIFTWATGEYIFMPLILDLLIFGPLIFVSSKLYNYIMGYVQE
jgi:hypothetical protein